MPRGKAYPEKKQSGSRATSPHAAKLRAESLKTAATGLPSVGEPVQLKEPKYRKTLENTHGEQNPA